MELPPDWLSLCGTARELIDGIYANAGGEQAAFDAMVAVLTDSQGQKKKKPVTLAKRPTREAAHARSADEPQDMLLIGASV